MDKIKIESPAEAMSLLRRARDEKGYTYRYKDPDDPDGPDSCYYFQDAEGVPITGHYLNAGTWEETFVAPAPSDLKPGCIVGHVLFYKGFRPEADQVVTKAIENKDAKTLCNFGRMKSTEAHVIDAEPIVAEILQAAQRIQDDGGTWGQAVDAANLVLVGYETALGHTPEPPGHRA